jgi:hypothetical protein
MSMYLVLWMTPFDKTLILWMKDDNTFIHGLKGKAVTPSIYWTAFECLWFAHNL